MLGLRQSSSTSAATEPSIGIAAGDIIAFVVFCRLRCRLTPRDLSMLLRGFTVSQESIRRWIRSWKLLPATGKALRKRKVATRHRRPLGQTWYVDELPSQSKAAGATCIGLDQRETVSDHS